jgi:hypothetical protein
MVQTPGNEHNGSTYTVPPAPAYKGDVDAYGRDIAEWRAEINRLAANPDWRRWYEARQSLNQPGDADEAPPPGYVDDAESGRPKWVGLSQGDNGHNTEPPEEPPDFGEAEPPPQQETKQEDPPPATAEVPSADGAAPSETPDNSATVSEAGTPPAPTGDSTGQTSGGTGAAAITPPPPRQPYPIDATEADLPRLTAEAWTALEQGNQPPSLFRSGGLPSRIERDDEGAPILRAMTKDRMRHRLADDAQWLKTVRRQKQDCQQPIYPPWDVVCNVLATPDPRLPILTRIVEAPTFAADGTLCLEPGYNPANRTYLVPAPGFTVPPVSAHPTAAEIKDARRLLTLELLGDFPFTDLAERAHAVAASVLPFVRDLIDGPTPLHSIEAPQAGTGKTLVAGLVTYPALGRTVTAMSEGRDEDEWRKRVFAKLRTAPAVLLLDNLKRRLESGALSSAITAWPAWEDRVLTTSEVARVPVRCVWLCTANNPAFSSEMTRRTVRIRLDAMQDQPWLREGFRHADIRQWARDNRAQLVWAALTLTRAWLAAGRPEGKTSLGMFERWAKVMGGILDVAGIPGFLGNLPEFYERSDAEGGTWRAFVASWWDEHKDKEITVANSKLLALADEAGLDLGDKEQGRRIRLGKLLATQRDRTFAVTLSTEEKLSLRIDQPGIEHKTKTWRLQQG